MPAARLIFHYHRESHTSAAAARSGARNYRPAVPHTQPFRAESAGGSFSNRERRHFGLMHSLQYLRLSPGCFFINERRAAESIRLCSLIVEGIETLNIAALRGKKCRLYAGRGYYRPSTNLICTFIESDINIISRGGCRVVTSIFNIQFIKMFKIPCYCVWFRAFALSPARPRNYTYK